MYKSADSELVTVELIRSFGLPLITYALEALNLRATDYLMLDNLLNNKLAKIFNISHDRVVLHDIRFYLGIPSMKASCMVRHMKFVRKAADIKNVAVQTALLILQNEPISMCSSVNVDIDCSYGAFYYAVNSCYS